MKNQSSELKIDAARREIFKDGRRVYFSPLEFNILNVIKTHYSQALTRQEIIKKAWGGRHALPRTVDQHIARIRRKVGRNAIETAGNYGYRIGMWVVS